MRVCCLARSIATVVLLFALFCLVNTGHGAENIMINSTWTEGQINAALRQPSLGGKNVTVALEVLGDGDSFNYTQMRALLNLEGAPAMATYTIMTSPGTRGQGKATFLCGDARYTVFVAWPQHTKIVNVTFKNCSATHAHDARTSGSSSLTFENVGIQHAHFDLENVNGLEFVGVTLGENAALTLRSCTAPKLRNIRVENVVEPVDFARAAITFESCSTPEIAQSSVFANNSAPVVFFERCSSPRLIGASFLSSTPGSGGTESAVVVMEANNGALIQKCLFSHNDVLSLKFVGMKNDVTPAQLSGCMFQNNSNTLSGKATAFEVQTDQQPLALALENCVFQGNRGTLGGAAVYVAVVKNLNMTVSGCNFTENTWGRQIYRATVVTPETLPAGSTALAIQFEREATGSEVRILQSTFTLNQAFRGGGLSVDFLNESNNNKVLVSGSTFTSNQIVRELCSPFGRLNESLVGQGGGCSLVFAENCTNNSVQIANSTLINNKAERGGALSVDFLNKSSNNKLLISQSTFTSNRIVQKLCSSSSGVDENPAGQGGACSLVFAGNCTNNFVQCANSTMTNNEAENGGGMAVVFMDFSADNEFKLEGSMKYGEGSQEGTCLFSHCNASRPEISLDASTQRTATSSGLGGGLFFQMRDNANSNTAGVSGCVLHDNSAISGGGLHADLRTRSSGPVLSLSNLTLVRNRALSGSGVLLSGNRPSAVDQTSSSPVIKLVDLSFTDNVAFYRGALAVDSLHFSTHGAVSLKHNHNSAIYLTNSVADHHGNMVIKNNVGHVGGGLVSIDSQLTVLPGSSLSFLQNTALVMGGAIFAHFSQR